MFSKLSSTPLATGMAALLLGSLALPVTAQAIELSSDNPSFGDTLVARHNSYGKIVLVNTNLGVSDLEKLQGSVKTNTAEIDSLKKTVSDQARLIEEFKRNSGSSSSSSSSDLSSLKREVSDQDRTIDQLKRTVEDLSRKVK